MSKIFSFIVFVLITFVNFQTNYAHESQTKENHKDEEAFIRNLFENHIKRYPKMQIEDVYKLLHQAAMGSEHAVSNEEAAFDWMQKEVAKLSGAMIKEPLIDPIAPDRKIVRVHLRPFVASKSDLKFLNKAFVQTANTFQGSKETLRRYLNYAVALLEKKELHIDAQAMKKFFAEKAAAGLPAVRHSKAFAENYSPAYRVVAWEELSDDLKETLLSAK
jgi:hypothetical protein